MKTMVAFSMALATLVLATAADANVQGERCLHRGYAISVRAGTPCVFGPLLRSRSRGLYSWGGLHPTEIIERPHNGTAVLRADGSVYYSPKPGFSGRDGLRVRRTDCDVPHCFIGESYVIFVE
jgi:hypothetical protein